MEHVLQAFSAAAQARPHWTYAVVALVAFAESLAVVGTFVPAAVVMFTAGALAGHGVVPIVPLLVVAITGAVAGDALSYEIGHRHDALVRQWGLYQRFPTGFARAEEFVQRHGRASIFVARFTGPVRAFAPLLAGVSRMPRLTFYSANVVSAALWAPVHVLPGVLLGVSLQLAEAVSGRLALLILLLAGLLWFSVWLTTRTAAWLVPKVSRLRAAAVAAARRHRGPMARLTLAVLDPERPGSQALLAGGLLLLASGWLFFGVLEDVLSHDPLTAVDLAVFQFLQGMRTSPVDRVMVVITEMGSVGVILPLAVVVLAWLLLRRCRRTAIYWVATVVFAELFVLVLKMTLGRHRPMELYAGADAFSFPSGHATLSTTVLGFLAYLLSRGRGWLWRLSVGSVAAAYVTLVAFSRLYLGAHWLSDVLGGISFGLAWVALVAMVYAHKGVEEDLAPAAMAVLCVVAALMFGITWAHLRSSADLRAYTPAPPVVRVRHDRWLADPWDALPRNRQEVAGDAQEPFAVQWACSEAGIRSALAAAGWQRAAPWSLATALLALAPETPLIDLPALPRFDRGRRSSIVLVRPVPGEATAREVIRLWRSEAVLVLEAGADVPLWYGAVYTEHRGALGGTLLRQEIVTGDTLRRALPGGLIVPAAAALDGPGKSGLQPVLLHCG